MASSSHKARLNSDILLIVFRDIKTETKQQKKKKSNKMSNHEEVELNSVLGNLLRNDRFHDIQLEGTDGVRTGANRAVLAARSDVFEKALFGDFAESNSEVIKLKYSGSVIAALVEYIHTDSASIFGEKCNVLSARSGVCIDTALPCITTLVSLAAAAAYYNLPGLCAKIADFLLEGFRQKISLACLVLSCCDQEGPSVPGKIKEAAFSHLRSNLMLLEKPDIPAIQLLSYNSVQEILEDWKIRDDEIYLFKLLQMWCGEDTGHPGEKTEGTSTGNEDRLEIARNLAEHIHLEFMSPSELSTIVTSSSLVPPARLALAYKEYSLYSEKCKEPCQKRCRYSESIWKKIRDGEVAESVTCSERYFMFMDSRVLLSVYSGGPIQWSFLLEHFNKGSAEFGLVNTRRLGVAGSFVGRFSEAGMPSSGTEQPRIVLDLESGSKITVIFDFDRETKLATLSAKVDEGEKHLMSSWKYGGGWTYRPAMILSKPSRIRYFKN